MIFCSLTALKILSFLWVDKFKNLEEMMLAHLRHLFQDSTFNLFNFYPNFFEKFYFPNSESGVSASAAYNFGAYSTCFYYINSSEIAVELTHLNMISSHK